MSNLVPVGARDLIFEPTESLSARIISAVEEKNDAEERAKEMEAALQRERRAKNGANLRGMLFFGMIIAAAAAAFFIWTGAQSQIDRANTERAEAIEARDLALEDLRAAATTNADQLVIIQAFDEYRTIADATYELRRMDEQLKRYSDEYRTQPTPGLNREDTIDVRSTEMDWLSESLADVKTDETRLKAALDAFDEWRRVRLVEPPAQVCLPKNPFRPRPPQPGCPT